MKKIIISVLSAALVFASCQKEAAPVSSGSSEVSFTATIPQTRTSFAPKDDDSYSYPVLWTGDEKVSVTYNFSTAKAAAVTASDDGSVATFAVELTEEAGAEAHNFYAVCPSSAQISASKDYQTLTVEFPSTQVPVDGSCDEAAQIIFAKHESTKFDQSVKFAFKHISAYGNLSLKLPSGVSEISSITLTADKPLAGRFYYSPAEDTFEANAGSNSITLNTGKTSEVFFACVPVDLGGTVLKVVIAANGTTYTKNINISSDEPLKFVQGRVSKFSVDMSGVSADAKVVYNLVTDPTTLKVGDKVIIAASNADVALGTTQNPNNRKAEAITKDGNTVVNPGAAVQILTLEKGTQDNTCAFNTGSGYLYAASSSKNYLKIQAEIDDNASFRVSYADGVTTIKAKGANTHNLLKYNSSSSIFSCYSSDQVDVVIYSDGKGTGAQLFSTAVDAPSTTPTYSSLAELVKAGEPTGGKVNVTLTNEKILSIYTTSKGYRNGIFLQAGDKEIEIFCKDVPAEWEVGGTVSGTLEDCTWTTYNGTWELCPADWSKLTYKAPAGGGETGNYFNSTYSCGSLDGWSLSNYTDSKSYYLIPAEGTESVAVISGIFNGKTIASDVVISLNVATFGSGDNPTASTFSIYSNSGCTVSATSAQSGTLPTSSSYTTAVYTVAKTDAAAFTNDLAIKVTREDGSKQIRLKSINVKFSYK